jgi:hypothetical protein
MSKNKILSKIKEIATEVLNLELESAEVVEETKEELKEEVQLAQEALDNGTVIEAESFEPGQAVFIVNEEERVPLPVGEYDFMGGVLVVSEEGMIAEISEKVAEEPEAEAEMEVEYVTVADFNTAIDEIKSMLSAQKKEADTVIENLEAEKVEMQKVIDEKPDAEAIPNKPKEVKLSETPAKSTKGRIYQFLNNKK